MSNFNSWLRFDQNRHFTTQASVPHELQLVWSRLLESNWLSMNEHFVIIRSDLKFMEIFTALENAYMVLYTSLPKFDFFLYWNRIVVIHIQHGFSWWIVSARSECRELCSKLRVTLSVALSQTQGENWTYVRFTNSRLFDQFRLIQLELSIKSFLWAHVWFHLQPDLV